MLVTQDVALGHHITSVIWLR